MKRSQATGWHVSSSVDPAWAWEPYRPSGDVPWNLARAGHLWRRAAHGGTWAELQQSLQEGPQETIDRLLADGEPDAEFEQRYREYERAAADASLEALQAWWLRRIIETPAPLQERLVLFWHNHFAISNAQVNSPPLMHAHIQRLRQHARGDYRQLLADLAQDPAVFLGLHGRENRKAQPNRYLATQLLDRWTTGPGGYGDRDLEQLARAWTGWFVLRGELRFFEREADPGPKTLFGQSGNWTAQDALRIAAEQPAAIREVVRRLVRWLVSETDEPSDAFLEPLCAAFRKDYHIGRLVARILRSNWFFAPAVYRQRVKSPVEFAVGLIRSFGGRVPTEPLPRDLKGLGQSLCEPPTLDGWAGGTAWLHPLTIVARANLAAALFRPGGAYKGKLDPEPPGDWHGVDAGASAEAWVADLLLQGPPSADLPPDPVRLSGIASPARRAAYRVAVSPEYQLA